MPETSDLLRLDSTPCGADPRATSDFTPREPRHLTILLLGRLVLKNGDDQLCRIRNISSGGLMLETRDRLLPGQAVDVQLRDLCTLRGRVAWARPPRAGITLEARTNVPELLRSISPKASGTHVPRAPRLSAACTVEVRCNGRANAARLMDVSQRGARLCAVGRMVDEQITVRIPGLDPQKAVVRWVHQDEFGVAFLEMLAFRRFEDWLQDRSVRYAARLD